VANESSNALDEVRELKYSLRSLIIVVSICALGCLYFRQAVIVPNIAAERHIRASPIKTRIREAENGEKWSDRVSYSVGQYGVSEFGNIRLAIRGGRFSGNSSSSVSLSNNLTFNGVGGGSSTGTGVTGSHGFTAYAIAGGTTCTFNGIPFDIISGKLILGGKEFDALGPPSVIVVDKNGRVESVHGISRPETISR
jgi:hypothetical protein